MSKEMPNITVLMSTYNGKLYIDQQLQSIYNQKGVNVRLTVRDDGSSDGTTDFLQSEQEAGRLTWYTGENLRPARSFMHLLTHADDCDWYAFADQDDFWMDDKLQTAISMLDSNDKETPQIYFCQTQLADAQLNPMPSVVIHPRLTYGESLVNQFIGGCTMVFNRKVRDLIRQYNPQRLYMHDIWIYSVVLAIGGKVVFDPTPHMLYRQHQNNVVGQRQSVLFTLKAQYARLKKNDHIRVHIAEELLNGYGSQMSEENLRLTQQIINYRNSLNDKFRLLTDQAYRCGNSRTWYLSRLLILLNMF